MAAIVTAVGSALLAAYAALWQPTAVELVHGRNNTALFLSFAEPGQINVQLATAQALLEEHPEIEIHLASFPAAAPAVSRAVGDRVHFHEIPGVDRSGAIARFYPEECRADVMHCLMHKPGFPSASYIASTLEFCMWSWTGEEHLQFHQYFLDLFDEVDPAVVVVDYPFRAAVDAVRSAKRVSAFMTPLAAADVFAVLQPYGAILWKYPSWGSGFSFPVPWRQMPANIWMGLLVVWKIAVMRPITGPTLKFLKQHGIDSGDIISDLAHRPFISQTLPEASIPLDYTPEKLINAGTILVDTAPAAQQDAELAEWIQAKETIVVNLGSLFKYTEERATTMALALKQVLDHSSVQVLWKMAPLRGLDLGHEYAAPIQAYVDSGRVRIMKWLTIDTYTLLRTNVVASIHHGGSSSYNEAITAGVPQVVIPMWQDLYNFAQLAEDLGVGIHATRDTAPDWTIDGLAEPMLRIIGDDEAAEKRRKEAQRIGEIARSKPGRYVAARAVADLAGTGKK